VLTESQRSELLARVLRKEYLAELCEAGKITPEQYLHSVNALRADEHLPPLTLADALRLPRRARPRLSKRKNG
jgi:hypothetical protein